MSAPVLDVVAGVLCDAAGRVLLAQRTAGRDWAGLWEFPGGKREAGESPQTALARELHEELGIAVSGCAPLIRIPFAYPGKRLVLDVYRVTAWSGTPVAREGQALRWLPVEALDRSTMPAADHPAVDALRAPALCLLTPEPDPSDPDALLRGIDAALARGVGRIHLRARQPDDAGLRALVEPLAARCAALGVPLFLHDRPRLAQAFGTGLHLGHAALMAARPGTLPDLPLSAACHDAAALAQAVALGAGAALVSPVRSTPTHPGAPVLGWEGFERLRERTSITLYALGGLGPDDLPEARRHGAQGVAGIRAFAATPAA